jgi:hypothetical protein
MGENKNMKIHFDLIVENDTMPFFAIDVNDITGEPEELYQQEKLFAFRNNAKVVNISHLNYRPTPRSQYSEELNDFVDSEKKNEITLGSDVTAFAYLINNVFYGATYLKSGNPVMDQLIAALDSNPSIVERFKNE